MTEPEWHMVFDTLWYLQRGECTRPLAMVFRMAARLEGCGWAAWVPGQQAQACKGMGAAKGRAEQLLGYNTLSTNTRTA